MLDGRVPEGSAGELHWVIHAWRLLDRVVFGRTHPCFYLTVWFQRERFEALLAVNTMEHAFSFHGAGGECHGSQDLGTSIGDSSLCGDEELAWCFVSWSSGIVSGGDRTGEVQSLTFQGENLRSGLNCLCLAMDLLKTLF